MKQQALYEGKAKIIYSTKKEGEVISYFKDDATAFNAAKRGQIEDKGVVNAKMTAILFTILEKRGIATHFISQLSPRELLVKKVTIIPIEVVVRNRAAGSLSKRFNIPKGQMLKSPLVEWYYKNDALQDPMLTSDHIQLLGLCTSEQRTQMQSLALKINDVLLSLFSGIGLDLVDFKIEFGTLASGQIVLADEISPDTCRLWDSKTAESMDKDRFRFDMGQVEAAYQEVLKRIGGLS